MGLFAHAYTRRSPPSARGERVGSVPFGFALDDDGIRLVPVEHEQATVARARALRAWHLSLRQVAARLAGEGHVSRTGRPFLAQQVARMLHNGQQRVIRRGASSPPRRDAADVRTATAAVRSLARRERSARGGPSRGRQANLSSRLRQRPVRLRLEHEVVGHAHPQVHRPSSLHTETEDPRP
jgi:hypothetical protein